MHAESFESNQLLSELVVDLRAQVGQTRSTNAVV